MPSWCSRTHGIRTCSCTIRRQFGDKMQTLETKRKRNAKLRMAKVLHPNAWVCRRFGLANLNLKFFVKLARGQSVDNSGTIKSKPKKNEIAFFAEMQISEYQRFFTTRFILSEILYYTSGQFSDNKIKTKITFFAKSGLHERVQHTVRTPSLRCLGNYYY